MFAARDQENLTHGHRVTASTKPLNQAGATNVAPPPKTPALKAVKTPFRAPLRDENALGGATGKPIPLKSEGKPGGGLGKNAFVTPFGPRNRAPLGQKTTNARAKPFQTPGLINKDGFDKGLESVFQGPPVKSTSHPLDAADVRPAEKDSEPEEREIEYMPPKPQDLPDLPDDISADIDYTPLRGANLTRGWYSTYINPVDDEGISLFERELDTRHAKVDEEILAQTEKLLEEIPSLEEIARAEAEEEDGDVATIRPVKQGVTVYDKKLGSGGIVKRGPPSTISSRQAASLLSKKTNETISRRGLQPVSSMTTAPMKTRPGLPFSNIAAIGGMRKKPVVVQQPQPPTNPSEMRHAAATAASRSTLGYAKGRVVSGELARGRIPSTSSSSSSITNGGATGRGINRGVNTVKTSTASIMTRSGIPARTQMAAPSRGLRNGEQSKSKMTNSEKGQGRAQHTETENKGGRGGGGRMKVSEYFYFLGTSDDEEEEEIVIDPYEGLEVKTTSEMELEGGMKGLDISGEVQHAGGDHEQSAEGDGRLVDQATTQEEKKNEMTEGGETKEEKVKEKDDGIEI